MDIVICTLFEKDYHFGVAALTNSLHKGGYRGTIYAGYRGRLPDWAAASASQSVATWDKAAILSVADGLQLIFLPLDTPHHLTNYKPDFMLDLIAGPAAQADAICYLDPDICLAEKWGFVQEWLSCGVTLCEDVNSPLPEKHPRRIGWRGYFQPPEFDLKFRASEYVNGGFVGVTRENYGFLTLWQRLQIVMSSSIGSLAASKLANGVSYKSKGFANCFDSSDQDALNATVEASRCAVSVIGKEAMGFKPGAAVFPHALGRAKPWQRVNLVEALKGRPPRYIDKLYLESVSSPIRCVADFRLRLLQIDALLATLVGRFYRRNA